MADPIYVRHLGLTDYLSTWRAMQTFTAERTEDTPDELWVTEHPPVYTLGLNRKEVRLPWRDDIPVVEVDRGGKITYHGPGQLIMYFMVDLGRRKLTVRHLVSAMEQSIIALLAEHGISAKANPNAPGVYVEQRKIASLGLRLKQLRSYHGLSLNIAMDTAPFTAIDPCGYVGQEVTQLQQLSIHLSLAEATEQLLQHLETYLQTRLVLKSPHVE